MFPPRSRVPRPLQAAAQGNCAHAVMLAPPAPERTSDPPGWAGGSQTGKRMRPGCQPSHRPAGRARTSAPRGGVQGAATRAHESDEQETRSAGWALGHVRMRLVSVRSRARKLAPPVAARHFWFTCSAGRGLSPAHVSPAEQSTPTAPGGGPGQLRSRGHAGATRAREDQ